MWIKVVGKDPLHSLHFPVPSPTVPHTEGKERWKKEAQEYRLVGGSLNKGTHVPGLPWWLKDE